MSSQPLWLSLEPRIGYTQLLLSQAGVGTMLKARLGSEPMHPGALPNFLEALSSWHGQPLCAVLDADAEEVLRSPERWARMMGEAAERPSISVQWAAPAQGRLSRDRFFDVPGFASARKLLVLGATGQR